MSTSREEEEDRGAGREQQAVTATKAVQEDSTEDKQQSAKVPTTSTMDLVRSAYSLAKTAVSALFFTYSYVVGNEGMKKDIAETREAINAQLLAHPVVALALTVPRQPRIALIAVDEQLVSLALLMTTIQPCANTPQPHH